MIQYNKFSDIFPMEENWERCTNTEIIPSDSRGHNAVQTCFLYCMIEDCSITNSNCGTLEKSLIKSFSNYVLKEGCLLLEICINVLITKIGLLVINMVFMYLNGKYENTLP